MLLFCSISVLLFLGLGLKVVKIVSKMLVICIREFLGLF